MREMRPLQLPALVAARRSMEYYDDLSSPADTPPSTHSRQSSQSTASDSAPATPPLTHTSRPHTRFPASTPLALSNTPVHDSMDSLSALRKPMHSLPDVAEEEPLERDELPDASEDNYGSRSFDHCRWSEYLPNDHDSYLMTPPAEYDLPGDFFPHRSFDEERVTKKRRSVSSFSSFARVWDRVGSLSKNRRERKSAPIYGYGSRAESNPSPVTPSRASSRASSYRGNGRDTSMDDPIERQHIHIETITEDEGKSNDPEDEGFGKVSTPLLHPLMVDTAPDMSELQSPLQSPSVASPTTALSNSNTPAGTPQVRGMPSPPLSAKPSVASFRRARNSYLVPSSEIPPMLISDSSDEWADKLGHANFDIEPEPYFPETCDGQSCQQLISDWECARSEYVKHLCRTRTHYGPTSQIYSLTQEKWAAIDAKWKEFHDLAVQTATRSGHSPGQDTPVEPAPVATIPNLDDPRFTKLGDDDIVGPMIQVAPQYQPRPTKRDRFFTAISSIQSPMRVLKRSFAGR